MLEKYFSSENGLIYSNIQVEMSKFLVTMLCQRMIVYIWIIVGFVKSTYRIILSQVYVEYYIEEEFMEISLGIINSFFAFFFSTLIFYWNSTIFLIYS